MARQPTATAKRPRTPTRKPATRKPRQPRSPKLREAEKQELARTTQLEDLYRPLREAAEAELQRRSRDAICSKRYTRSPRSSASSASA